MEVVVTTGAISHAKLQSNDHHQQTNTQFYTGWMPFLLPNQQCQSTEGKNITFHGLAYTRRSPGVFQLCLWPLIAPSYLWGGLPCLSSALWCQYPILLYVSWGTKCSDCHAYTRKQWHVWKKTQVDWKCPDVTAPSTEDSTLNVRHTNRWTSTRYDNDERVSVNCWECDITVDCCLASDMCSEPHTAVEGQHRACRQVEKFASMYPTLYMAQWPSS